MATTKGREHGSFCHVGLNIHGILHVFMAARFLLACVYGGGGGGGGGGLASYLILMRYKQVVSISASLHVILFMQ